jgi:hypothetical protein
MNLYIPVPKIEALHMGSKTQNYDFLETSSYNLDYILVIYGDCLPK